MKTKHTTEDTTELLTGLGMLALGLLLTALFVWPFLAPCSSLGDYCPKATATK